MMMSTNCFVFPLWLGVQGEAKLPLPYLRLQIRRAPVAHSPATAVPVLNRLTAHRWFPHADWQFPRFCFTLGLEGRLPIRGSLLGLVEVAAPFSYPCFVLCQAGLCMLLLLWGNNYINFIGWRQTALLLGLCASLYLSEYYQVGL